MKTDALARRLRFAPPNAKVARLILTEADYLIFEEIDRHGPLPIHYLYHFTKHVRRNYANLQKRLTEFYNGDDDGPYLTRPQQQFDAFEARYQHMVYDLAPRARRALNERISPYPPTGSAWFLHQLMQACVGASLELTAASKGLRYVSRPEILMLPQCTNARDGKNPMAIPLTDKKKLIPDDMFALENAEGRKRYFLVEIDRATESMKPYEDIRRSTAESTTYFSNKLASYLSLMKGQVLKEHFGMVKPTVLIGTTFAEFEEAWAATHPDVSMYKEIPDETSGT